MPTTPELVQLRAMVQQHRDDLARKQTWVEVGVADPAVSADYAAAIAALDELLATIDAH